ncbi:MAG TPA: polymer-forming cytoskeletal protein [Thermoanaerobaculia bacterium]|jgi:cytoskeletal protein CcmA (bactofilin family)|nr:polymer-forming cytoskeletal protein [Thermoanaerobaculia bacterium]
MAWNKRDDPPTNQPEPTTPMSPPRPSAAPAPTPAAAAAAPEPPRRTDRATIGPSIFIKGDLSGEEDLVIEGRVEGKVDLKQNNVTIGKNGKVRADVFGKVVIIEGEVDGNVFAREQAILRQSGGIKGNITAPRVILEDGSRFKGSIDMEPPKDNASSQPSRQDQHREREQQNRENRSEAAGVKANAG